MTPSAELQPLDRRVRTVWQVTALIGTSPLTLGLLVLAVVVGTGGEPLVALGAVVGIAVVVGLAVGVPVLRYRTWSWGLTDEGVELARGLLVRETSAIPTFRVQQVDVSQGPIERAFGVVTLTITTASSGSDGTIPGVDADRADEVRRRILERVAVDDGV